MALRSWEERYQDQETGPRPPDPLLVEAAGAMPPGRALDLACGTGRNALWLAQQGWNVTAVDGSPIAIAKLQAHAVERNRTIDARVADLEKDKFAIEPARWDLIAICYYLQRDLYERAKQGVVPGGVIVAIALMIEPGKEQSPYRVRPGELRSYFSDWDVRAYRENGAAEIAARRPLLP